MFDKDNRLVPLTTTNVSTGTAVTNQTPTTSAFRPEKIYWYNTYATINAGSAIGGNTLLDIGYNANSTNSTSGGGMAVCNFNETVSAYRLIYLCGTYNKTTGLFTLRDAGVASSKNYYKLVPTNTANITLSSYFTEGYDYILLGGTYSSNNYVHLMDTHPMYHFDGTNLVPYDTYNENRIEGLIPDTYYLHILNYDMVMFNGQSAPYTGKLPFYSKNFQPCIAMDNTAYTNKVIKNLFDNSIYADAAQASLGEWTYLGDDTKYEVLSFNQSTGVLSLRNNTTLTDITLNLRDVSSMSMVYTSDASIVNDRILVPNSYDGDTWVLEGSRNYVKSINGSTGAITNVAKTNTNNSFPFIQTFTGTIDASSGTLKVRTVNAPTTSGGSSYGAGTDGQVLKSNGTTIYWGNSGGSSALYKHQITIYTDYYDFDITVVNTISSAMALWEVTNYYSYHLFMMANDWAGAYIYRAGANDYKVNFITLSFDSPTGSPGFMEYATASTISDTVTQLS